ncbi:MAG: hypothetical protein ACKOX1_05405 [Ignavibacteria bacterium]
MRYIAFIFVIGLLCSGCSLLEPRTPESPENTTQYDPAFDYQTVLVNIQKSIQYKDPTGYIRCFSDTLNSSKEQYVFEPSIEVLTRYGNLFSQWNINQERVYFQNIMSKIPKDAQTALQLYNTVFDGITPDSVIIQSDYRLIVPHGMSSISNEANGSLRFVMKRQNDGLWSIQRWSDFLAKNDTIGNTWSTIKAQFNN